jgi:hypothetical protein
MIGLPPIRNIDEARALLRSGLGKVEIEFVSSITAPIWWVERGANDQRRLRNGSSFFLRIDDGLFCVTAAHVITALLTSKTSGVVQACLGPQIDIDIENRLIDLDPEIDLATLRVSDDEIASMHKFPLSGQQRTWPPNPPVLSGGVLMAGFPETEQRWVGNREISLGVVGIGSIASSISERDVASQIEREHLMDMIGKGLPKANYDYSGMSGGPLITVVENAGIRSWRLGGIIYSGPNISNDPDVSIEGFELIRARRPDYLLPGGAIDRARWH